tara:strand:- start:1168 stop:1554 length:387 start_codon:yes stop_codon:yes gene_type:complete
MREETQAEKEERQNDEYIAQYCKPSVCKVCRWCKHCEECVCDDAESLRYRLMQIKSEDEKKMKEENEMKEMSEDERNEMIGALLKIKAVLPDNLPNDYYNFTPELEAEIEKAAKKLYERLYPNGDDVQ